MRALRAASAVLAVTLTSLGAGAMVHAGLLNGQPEATTEPAPPGAEPEPELSIGVVPQAELSHNDLRMMGEAGIDSVRLVLAWSRVERHAGLYDWSEIDELVASASRLGITPLALLYGSPRWATAAAGGRCEPSACAALGPVSTAATERFARFAGMAARRYGPGGTFWWLRPDLPEVPVRSWEVWNEPNSPAFFAPVVDPQAYGELLARTAAQIHAADAGAQVLIGGLVARRFSAGGTTAPIRYLRELLVDPDARDAFDGVGIHPYAGGIAGVLRQVRTIRRLLDDTGLRERDLWVTEVGWASSGNRRHPLVSRPRGQARLLGRVFRQLARRAERWSLRAAHWYAWRDTAREQAVCAWCAGTGLLDTEGRPKPAWRRISAIARR